MSLPNESYNTPLFPKSESVQPSFWILYEQQGMYVDVTSLLMDQFRLLAPEDRLPRSIVRKNYLEVLKALMAPLPRHMKHLVQHVLHKRGLIKLKEDTPIEQLLLEAFFPSSDSSFPFEAAVVFEEGQSPKVSLRPHDELDLTQVWDSKHITVSKNGGQVEVEVPKERQERNLRAIELVTRTEGMEYVLVADPAKSSSSKPVFPVPSFWLAHRPWIDSLRIRGYSDIVTSEVTALNKGSEIDADHARSQPTTDNSNGRPAIPSESVYPSTLAILGVYQGDSGWIEDVRSPLYIMDGLHLKQEWTLAHSNLLLSLRLAEERALVLKGLTIEQVRLKFVRLISVVQASSEDAIAWQFAEGKSRPFGEGDIKKMDESIETITASQIEYLPDDEVNTIGRKLARPGFLALFSPGQRFFEGKLGPLDAHIPNRIQPMSLEIIARTADGQLLQQSVPFPLNTEDKDHGEEDPNKIHTQAKQPNCTSLL